MAKAVMRSAGAALLGLSLLAAACSEPNDARTDAPLALEGDQSLIAAAQVMSDQLDGCEAPQDLQHESRVVGLGDVSIVMIACSDTATHYTDRVFAVGTGEEPRLLAFADYGDAGWFATFDIGMAELDAGAGVLTTLRSDGPNDVCGSEGRYLWDGRNFSVEELAWRGCSSTNTAGPPFTLIWPPQVGSTVDPESATPAP